MGVLWGTSWTSLETVLLSFPLAKTTILLIPRRRLDSDNPHLKHEPGGVPGIAGVDVLESW